MLVAKKVVCSHQSQTLVTVSNFGEIANDCGPSKVPMCPHFGAQRINDLLYDEVKYNRLQQRCPGD